MDLDLDNLTEEQCIRLTNPQLLVGDVLIYADRRFEVIGHTPKGKLLMRRESGTEMSAWWRSWSDVPRGYHIERDGVRIR